MIADRKLFGSLTLAISAFGVLALVACGDDSGTSPSGSSSSGPSSSSAYAPPGSDPDAPVKIEDFAVRLGTSKAYLEGTVYIDDTKNQDVKTVDSLVFGVAPAGPKVVTKTIVPADEFDLEMDLDATIDLKSFEGCGTYTVYVTAYALGKAVTDSATFEKPASFCAVSSSSSAVVAIPLDSVKFRLGTQNKFDANVAIDLDSRAVYTLANLSANAASVDLLFGYKDGAYYLYTPKGVDGVITEYASAVAASYTGKVYDTEISSTASLADAAEIVYKAVDADDMIEVQSGTSVAVTSDQYNATTRKGLYLIQFTGTALTGDDAETSITIRYVK